MMDGMDGTRGRGGLSLHSDDFIFLAWMRRSGDVGVKVSWQLLIDGWRLAGVVMRVTLGGCLCMGRMCAFLHGSYVYSLFARLMESRAFFSVFPCFGRYHEAILVA